MTNQLRIDRNSRKKRATFSLMIVLMAIIIGFGVAAQNQTLFSDDFQDGNADGWTRSSGSWSVVTDGSLAYRQSGTSADSNARAGSSSWTNYSVQARVKPIAFNGADRYAGLMARVTNSNHYYYLALQNGNRLVLGKRAGSSPIVLASKSFSFSRLSRSRRVRRVRSSSLSAASRHSALTSDMGPSRGG